MGYCASNEEEKRFTGFTKDLTKISKKYGIVISVVVGVYFIDQKEDKKSIANLSYTDDATSGDLEPLNFYDN